MRPKTVEINDVIAAIGRLVMKKERMNPLWLKNLPYHLSENPLGGNRLMAVGLNDVKITTITGARRKPYIAIIVK